MVNTAFAFAAAARKSSTVFGSAAEKLALETRRMSEIQRNGDFMKRFDIRVEKLKPATDLHRFSQMGEGILMNLAFICVDLWRDPALMGRTVPR
jgi:hypothetical protein